MQRPQPVVRKLSTANYMEDVAKEVEDQLLSQYDSADQSSKRASTSSTDVIRRISHIVQGHRRKTESFETQPFLPHIWAYHGQIAKLEETVEKVGVRSLSKGYDYYPGRKLLSREEEEDELYAPPPQLPRLIRAALKVGDISKMTRDQRWLIANAFPKSTPLHYACANDQYHVVEYLLGLGLEGYIMNGVEKLPEHYTLSDEIRELIWQHKNAQKQKAPRKASIIAEKMKQTAIHQHEEEEEKQGGKAKIDPAMLNAIKRTAPVVSGSRPLPTAPATNTQQHVESKPAATAARAPPPPAPSAPKPRAPPPPAAPSSSTATMIKQQSPFADLISKVKLPPRPASESASETASVVESEAGSEHARSSRRLSTRRMSRVLSVRRGSIEGEPTARRIAPPPPAPAPPAAKNMQATYHHTSSAPPPPPAHITSSGDYPHPPPPPPPPPPNRVSDSNETRRMSAMVSLFNDSMDLNRADNPPVESSNSNEVNTSDTAISRPPLVTRRLSVSAVGLESVAFRQTEEGEQIVADPTRSPSPPRRSSVRKANNGTRRRSTDEERVKRKLKEMEKERYNEKGERVIVPKKLLYPAYTPPPPEVVEQRRQEKMKSFLSSLVSLEDIANKALMENAEQKEDLYLKLSGNGRNLNPSGHYSATALSLIYHDMDIKYAEGKNRDIHSLTFREMLWRRAGSRMSEGLYDGPTPRVARLRMEAYEQGLKYLKKSFKSYADKDRWEAIEFLQTKAQKYIASLKEEERKAAIEQILHPTNTKGPSPEKDPFAGKSGDGAMVVKEMRRLSMAGLALNDFYNIEEEIEKFKQTFTDDELAVFDQGRESAGLTMNDLMAHNEQHGHDSFIHEVMK